MNTELEVELHRQVTILSEKGNALVDAGRLDEALEAFISALELLPEPVTKWEAATWLLTALGDTLFFKGDYENAKQALQDAMHCPGAIGNPFIHLRLGQVQLELGNERRAADELTRALMGGGDEIFENQDPKYRRWLAQYLNTSRE